MTSLSQRSQRTRGVPKLLQVQPGGWEKDCERDLSLHFCNSDTLDQLNCLWSSILISFFYRTESLLCLFFSCPCHLNICHSVRCHSNQCVDSQFSWHHSLRISFGSVIRNILCHGLTGNCISCENCFEIKQNFEKLMMAATESVKSMISSSQHPGKGINRGKNSYFSTIYHQDRFEVEDQKIKCDEILIIPLVLSEKW